MFINMHARLHNFSTVSIFKCHMSQKYFSHHKMGYSSLTIFTKFRINLNNIYFHYKTTCIKGLNILKEIINFETIFKNLLAVLLLACTWGSLWTYLYWARPSNLACIIMYLSVFKVLNKQVSFWSKNINILTLDSLNVYCTYKVGTQKSLVMARERKSRSDHQYLRKNQKLAPKLAPC